MLSFKPTLFYSLTLKKCIFLINLVVKKAINCKQQQQQHFLLGGYKLKDCVLSSSANWKNNLKRNYFSIKTLMFYKLENIWIKVSNLMLKKKQLPVVIEMTVILSHSCVYWDMTISFLSTLGKRCHAAV